ncbi:hypothetical protein [Clostridium cochlearium]|uniref:Uncharacterized protein n=1 Tax=Clostridium cochlearium TaxID=1494 RepID=A0A7Y3V5Z4_CLOCO|nr:hypothetical protein [Clostridium cochlearium]NOH15280.1 hypothetical protein [Clostridium cochlearium]
MLRKKSFVNIISRKNVSVLWIFLVLLLIRGCGNQNTSKLKVEDDLIIIKDIFGDDILITRTIDLLDLNFNKIAEYKEISNLNEEN